MNNFDIRNIRETTVVIFNGKIYQFDIVEHFGNRLICYSDKSIYFFYDYGKVENYDDYAFKNHVNCIEVRKGNLYGIYSSRGIKLIPVEYDYISFMSRVIDCYKKDKGHMLYMYDGTPITKDFANHVCYCDNWIEIEYNDNNLEKYSYELLK